MSAYCNRAGRWIKLSPEQMADLAMANPLSRRRIKTRQDAERQKVIRLHCPICQGQGWRLQRARDGIGFVVVYRCLPVDQGGCDRVAKQVTWNRKRRGLAVTIPGHNGGKGGAPR